MALGCYFSEKDDTDLLNVTQVVLISHDFVKYFFGHMAHLWIFPIWILLIGALFIKYAKYYVIFPI